MKYLYTLGLSLFVLFTFSCKQAPSEPEVYTEIPWTSMDKVEGLVKKNSKKILVDVYTPWCGPCKLMDKNTFTDPEIIDLVSKNFYPVKFNAEGPDPLTFQGKTYSNPRYDPAKGKRRNFPHELSSYFQVRGYPAMVVLDENMKIVDKVVGYKPPAQLKEILSKHFEG